MKSNNIFIQHAENIGEKEIILNKKKIKFDGYCEDTNTVFEFHGDFWHGNPNKFNRTDINPFNKKSYGKLYDDTIKREEIIKSEGYNLITIWESDYYNLI